MCSVKAHKKRWFFIIYYLSTLFVSLLQFCLHVAASAPYVFQANVLCIYIYIHILTQWYLDISYCELIFSLSYINLRNGQIAAIYLLVNVKCCLQENTASLPKQI